MRSTIRLWLVLAAAAGAAPAADDFMERLLAAGQLHRQGEYAGAENILLAALKDADNFPPDDPRRAIVLNNLGSVYQYMNRYSQAERCYRRAVEIEEKLPWTVDDKPFRSILNLAALYIEAGQYEKAERLGLRTLAEQLRPRRDNLDFARLLLLLGDLEKLGGEYGKAQEYYEGALVTSENSAEGGSQTVDTLNNLCVLYSQSGRNADALSRCERALRISEGMDHLEPFMQPLLLANVGTLRFLVNGPADAEPFYVKALAVAESRLGQAHPILGRILLSYADLLDRTNRKPEAKRCRRRAGAILDAAPAADLRKYTVGLSDLLKGQSRR